MTELFCYRMYYCGEMSIIGGDSSAAVIRTTLLVCAVMHAKYRRPRPVKNLYILVVLFFSGHRFFDVPEPVFAKLCHTTRYDLKLITHYGVFIRAPKSWMGKKPQFSQFS